MLLEGVEPINEITRLELIKKIREDTKSRFDRRLEVKENEVIYYPIDSMMFYNHDKLLFQFKIRDYRVSLEIDGILGYIRDHLNEMRINYKNIRQLLLRSVDESDIRVDCTCPDFRYRFAYTATKDGFKEGNEEKRPSLITNPDKKGGACKHIMRVLNNKQWMYKYVSLINVLIKLKPAVVQSHS